MYTILKRNSIPLAYLNHSEENTFPAAPEVDSVTSTDLMS